MDTKELQEKLRAHAEARREAGVRVRFDEAFRAEVLRYVEARKEEGSTLEAAARELGMSSWTLSRWGQRARCAGAQPAQFHPVKVSEAVSRPRGLMVTAPGGVRVEGLSVAEVAELLKALA